MSENIKRCVDCFHYNACKDWVDGWVGKDSIFPYEANADEVLCEYFKPTADVAEVRHGKWRVHDSDLGYVQFACSLCEELVTLDDEEKPYPYCPNCGAKMDAERKEQ